MGSPKSREPLANLHTFKVHNYTVQKVLLFSKILEMKWRIFYIQAFYESLSKIVIDTFLFQSILRIIIKSALKIFFAYNFSIICLIFITWHNLFKFNNKIWGWIFYKFKCYAIYFINIFVLHFFSSNIVNYKLQLRSNTLKVNNMFNAN